MNHGSNDVGRVHEEVLSPVLPVLMNLTGLDTSVVRPWGGKNTAGVGLDAVGTVRTRVISISSVLTVVAGLRGLAHGSLADSRTSFFWLFYGSTSIPVLLFTHRQWSAGFHCLVDKDSTKSFSHSREHIQTGRISQNSET